jgi:hypothetical protein
MTPEELIKTIYLGDRVCDGICIDFCERRIKLQIDCISRVRSPSGQWEYYNDENIDNGYIVLSDVESYAIVPMGFFVNDYIYDFTIKNIEHESSSKTIYTFSLETGYTTYITTINGTTTFTIEPMEIEISAREFWLEDPRNPGVRIVE